MAVITASTATNRKRKIPSLAYGEDMGAQHRRPLYRILYPLPNEDLTRRGGARPSDARLSALEHIQAEGLEWF